MKEKKNNGVSLIIIALGLLLIIGGVVFYFLNNNNSSTNENTNTQPEKLEEKKRDPLRKITDDELDNDIAKEIIEYYIVDKYPNDKKELISAILLADNGQTRYYVKYDYKIEDVDNYFDYVVLNYLGNGEWKVDFYDEKPEDIPQEFENFYGQPDDGED